MRERERKRRGRRHNWIFLGDYSSGCDTMRKLQEKMLTNLPIWRRNHYDSSVARNNTLYRSNYAYLEDDKNTTPTCPRDLSIDLSSPQRRRRRRR